MKCAFYEKEITPPLGSHIPGYYAERPTEDVEDRLYAKAVVFDDEKGGKAALLIFDGVFMDADFRIAISHRVAEFTDIPEENIVVAVNHSHYGIPSGDPYAPKDEEYMALFPRLAADCITLANLRLKPCTLSYGITTVEGICQNRDYILNNGRYVTNPKQQIRGDVVRSVGGIDPDLPLLLVSDEAGKPMGGIFTYALHQDTTSKKKYSGDYASEVSNQLKAQYGESFVSIYMAGCCGDINHVDVLGNSVTKTHREIGKIVADGVLAAAEVAAPIAADRVIAKTEVVRSPRRRVSEEQLAHCKWVLEDYDNRKDVVVMLGKKGFEQTIAYHERTKDFPDLHELMVRILQIGEVTLFSLPGELYHQYGEALKKLAPTGKWLISELANSEGGYICTPDLFETDIYPAWLCYGSFMTPAAGAQMVEAAERLVQDLK